jgi:F1F0 ATPase subunit 2
MTNFPHPAHVVIPVVLSIASLVAGLLLGAVYFLSLRWNLWRFTVGRSLLIPVGIQLVRFALIAAALAVVARYFGALQLLVTTLGILVARTAVIKHGMQS